MTGFAELVVAWQRVHGRHDLPWQRTRDAYRVWLSEIMLQQTQVAAVVPYYERFVARFPNLRSLAEAQTDDVMAAWSGLGYYARARNLHACARRVLHEHRGAFPSDVESLETLPGIGRSTAAAIAVFAFGGRAAILDGNVKRVFARHRGIEGWPGSTKVARTLWAVAESALPEVDIEPYTQGMMDLGATVCVRKSPHCDACPVRETCVARRLSRIDAFPAARPRSATRVRTAHMLLAMRDGAVLLERRPPMGIWGGLWSLPQYDDETALARAAATLVPDHALQPLGERTHAFTHYTLVWRPHRLDVGGAATPRFNDRDTAWWPLDAIDRAALPAPIRSALLALSERDR